MANINKDVIIVGAGLTGLVTAYYLKKNNMNPIVLEKEPRAGGVINTFSENGFIYEAGPNTGVLSTPEIAELFGELNGSCSLETARSSSKKRYILKNGKWEALPSGPVSAIRTPLFTLKDKFRILGEPFRKPGTDPDESIAGMVRRRLGKSFLDYAVDPFISGIYAGDPETLVTRFALPKLYALEQNYGSFIRGSVQKAKIPKTEAQKKATGEVFSVRNGLGNLVTALAAEVGEDCLLTGLTGIKVSPIPEGFDVTFVKDDERKAFSAPTIVTTYGGDGLGDLLPFLDKELLSPVEGIRYAGVVQVVAGYRNWNGHPLDAFGGLIPSREKRGVLGILFPSAIFDGRAPVNGALLSVFMGGAKKPGIIDLSDEDIMGIVLREIRETLNGKGDPDLFRIFRYRHAIPQYEKSSEERLASIKRIGELYPGLILAGNVRDGIGMADRVKQAKLIAEKLIAG